MLIVHSGYHNHPEKKILRHLAHVDETRALGVTLGKLLVPGMVLHLQGDLGTGKTTLVRAVLEGRGFRGKVKSPTYTLVESYVISNIDLYHFDFYRFNEPNEWEESGFREYFNANSICFVEWPEKAGGLLNMPDLKIEIMLNGAARDMQISAMTTAGHLCLDRLDGT